MPVYAYDVPPHLYTRIAPHIGADIAVVGSLPDGGYEQLLGEPRFHGGLQQSTLVQVLLDLSHLVALSPSSLRWTLLSFVPDLAGGGTRFLALVLPTQAAALADELRALAAQQIPALAFACFLDSASAIFWLATQIPGAGAPSTPEEVRAEAAEGRWVEAVARYRALTASPLAVAVEVVEGLLRDAPRLDPAAPTSLVPSTEHPPAQAPQPPALEMVSNETPPEQTRSFVPPRELLDEFAASPASSPTVTRASLGQIADTASRLATAPTQFQDEPSTAPGTSREHLAAEPSFQEDLSAALSSLKGPSDAPSLREEPPVTPGKFQDELTTARDLDDSLFPSHKATPESEFTNTRLRDFEPLLRSTLSRIWFVASEDGERVSLTDLDGHRGIEAHEESREDAPLALSGARLTLLFRSDPELIRFSPEAPAEVSLRRHQLPHAREFLSGILVEEHLDALPDDAHARERCLNHDFLVLLERSDQADRVVLLAGPGGREALLFSLPDVLLRFLQARPEDLQFSNLCMISEQGDSLLEKLLVLPLDGVRINPGGPGETRLSRAQLKQILRPGVVSLPPEAAPTEAVPPEALASTPSPGTASSSGAASSSGTASSSGAASSPRSPSPPATPSSSESPSSSASSSASPSVAPPSFSPPRPRVSSPPAPSAPSASRSEAPSAPPRPGSVAPPAPSAPRSVAPPSMGARSEPSSQGGASEPPQARRFHARSLAEAHFFLDARGFERQERYQWKEVQGNDTLWVFMGKGPGGRQERLEFLLATEMPAAQDGYFGAGPSPLLGPVELLQRAGAMIRSSSGTPLGLPPDELARATSAAEMAYILVMEALRHYGSDDMPPPSSLHTDEERQALAREPARFQRGRVEELARSYWHIAMQLGEALRGKP